MKEVLLSFVCLFSVSLLSAQEVISGNSSGTTVTIGGLKYKLSEDVHTAMVANGNSWEGELKIPELVTYNGEIYIVDRIEWIAFKFCETLTKVRIPKTVVDIVHYARWEDCKNPFNGCTGLERIEVDEDNPSMCSVNGVLYNKDRSRLYSYPAGAKDKAYTIPDGVTWLGMDAFAYNPYIESVEMPNSVSRICSGLFTECEKLKSVRISENISLIPAYTFDKCISLHFLDIPKSVRSFAESVFRNSPLDTIVIRGTFPEGLRTDTFFGMSESTIIYVQSSEISKFQSMFSGTVLPLEEYTDQVVSTPAFASFNTATAVYDLQGRRLTGQPRRGIYVKDGKKFVAK